MSVRSRTNLAAPLCTIWHKGRKMFFVTVNAVLRKVIRIAKLGSFEKVWQDGSEPQIL
jgi:hypothetical protein